MFRMMRSVQSGCSTCGTWRRYGSLSKIVIHSAKFEVLVETDAHSDVVSSLAFKDNLLISGGADGLVNVIDPAAAEEEYVIATVNVCFSNDPFGRGRKGHEKRAS